MQLIRGPWKLIPGSLNIYLVDSYEIEKNIVDYAYALFKSVSATEKNGFSFEGAECLKSNFQNIYVFPSMLGFKERCFFIFIAIKYRSFNLPFEKRFD